MVSTPSSSFQSAASYLSSASALSSTPPSVKLELYGIFKRLTASQAPTTSRPSIFDMTGRAKWDAWAQAGKTYAQGKEREAEQRYMEIAQSLGWHEDVNVEGVSKNEIRGGRGKQKEEDDIWDEDDGNSARHDGGTGMGLSVSTITASPSDVNDMNTLHGLALSNDLPKLASFLKDHPESDVNAYDEFGYTPLHLAADRGHLEIMQFLIKSGADANLKDTDDFTALELARVAGRAEIEAFLEKLKG